MTRYSNIYMCVYISLSLYIYIYISLKFASRLAVFGVFGCFRASPALARNVAICCIWLHLAARAWPGAADRSKWLLEPALEPQIARNGRSSPPRSRRILEKCCSSLPRSATPSNCVFSILKFLEVKHLSRISAEIP